MKNLKTLMIVVTFAFFCFMLSSPAVLAANIIIDKQAGSAGTGLFHTPNYANDAACFQAALDKAKSGDTITIRQGDYYITKRVYQSGKNLKLTGEGKVTLHIQTPEKEIYGLYFSGSLVTNKKLAANVKKGSSQVVLPDASQVRQNDLIKIWKNAQWCPLDYPDQMTGEVYSVKSVSGNVVTLNQPLLRDYTLSETSQVEVYRPVQVHIKNIRIQDTGAKMSHHGLAMQYCRDSSVTNSWFKDSGFGAVCLYSCFNVDVNNNEIYNCLLPGSGYGVAVCSGSAFINIENNHIENCRHAITGNSAERKSLNRDVCIAGNTLIGANIDGSCVVDSHPVTINFVVTKNKIYPQLPDFFAFSDGTQQSTFSSNEVFGGYGGISRRGSVSDGVHVYENNRFNSMAGNIYQGGKSGTNYKLIIRNNIQKNGLYGIYFPAQESFRNIVISGNTFSDLSCQGVYQKFLIKGVNLEISNNTFANIKKEGVYIDGNSLANGAVKIQNNILINVNPQKPSSGITIKNVQKPAISGNQISKAQTSKVPAAAFSASPTSGYTPLTVKFTDRSTNSPTAWNWNFGDGTTNSKVQNPTHAYSKAGTYTVTLTASNSAGSNTATRSKYITATAPSTIKPPVVSFWASRVTGKAPITLGFTDASTNTPNAWNWNFGDGTSSTLRNPKHTYTKAGTYTITLKASNAGGSGTMTKTKYIKIT
jgi:PKD repeat protein